MFSVDTEEQAESMIVAVGSLGMDRNYYISSFGGELEDMDLVADKMDMIYKERVK